MLTEFAALDLNSERGGNPLLTRYAQEVESRNLKPDSKAYKKARREFFANEVNSLTYKLADRHDDCNEVCHQLDELFQEKGSQDDRTQFKKRIGLYQHIPPLQKLSTPRKKMTKAQVAMVEFAAYMGSETRLDNWQRLCADLKISPVPKSIKGCRAAIGKVQVNIFDFLDDPDTAPHFPTVGALSGYSKKHNKVFPLREAKERGALRGLLRRF